MSSDEYIFDGVLRLGEQIMLFGARGSCKSYLSNLLAISLASGTSILNNTFRPLRAFKVLYIDGEMNIKLIKQRIQAIQNGLGIDPHVCDSNLNILASTYLRENFDFSNKKQLQKFKKDIENAEIIFLDSVNFIFPGAMSNDVTSCKSLNDFILKNRSNNKTVFTIDHASTKSVNQKNIKDPFGSSAKSFSMDIILTINKNKDNFHVIPTKSRSYHVKYFDFQFSLEIINDKVLFQLKNPDSYSTANNLNGMVLKNDELFVLFCISKSIMPYKDILDTLNKSQIDSIKFKRSKLNNIMKFLENSGLVSSIGRNHWIVTENGSNILQKTKDTHKEIYAIINSK